MLLVLRHFGTAEPGTLATMGKASMQRVGTEIGTAVRRGPSGESELRYDQL
jgi:hypothetical protein